MDATTPVGSAAVTTSSMTIADLLPRAVKLFGGRPAVRHRLPDGTWRDVTYAEVGEIAQAAALGLIDLGIRPGDRVCLLADTRPEWTYLDFAIAMIGAVSVSVYPTNSLEECEWVIGDSGAVAIICEDAVQLAKVAATRDRLPELREVIVIDPSPETGATTTLDELCARGRTRPDGAAELQRRHDAVTPDAPYTFMYTSGTTGPPKGCVLTHGNYRSVTDMINDVQTLSMEADVVYLFLPLAHAFARLVELATFDCGMQIAYWSRDKRRLLSEIAEVRPTFLPSVPRIFEKLYALGTADLDPDTIVRATEVGGRYHDLRVAGEPIPDELAEEYAELDARVFRPVRDLFGGRLRTGDTGSAPIAPEILDFFWACGVPVLDGFGMTETATSATGMGPANRRSGTVGRPHPGVEARIADDGELLIKGPNVFVGYHNNPEATAEAFVDGWLRTGDLATIDADGYITITGRKKDIIITAGGKNITPANLENDLKQSPYISQAVMHGDRRPYPVVLVTLDEDQIVPWARARGIEDTSLDALAAHPEVRTLVDAELARANRRYAPVEQAKKLAILDHDLSVEAGELTPTLKVKRSVVEERHRQLLDSLYG